MASGVEKKKTIGIIFLILFLDLVGFSIIFPLFPSLAKYYLELDPSNTFLRAILKIVDFMGDGTMSPIVLFGGVLGALYSLLQFIFAPIWGTLSDRYGRKPILITSCLGLLLSYVLWFFSGSFTLLVIARFIGGMMGGNIGAATAVVADITTEENRSKGMALVGIAFALGFIIGPALGGLLSLIRLDLLYPSLVSWGVNPFSTPALLASILSLIALLLVVFVYKETNLTKKSINTRTSNLLTLFSQSGSKSLNWINWSYFIFILAFSGMEFTLTFLALDRLGYSSKDNAYMFVFIGFILVLVQGGFIRRRAHKIGEKKVALLGLLLLIPGLIILIFSHSSFTLYCSLFFFALGSACITPCMTSLVSLFSSKADQGSNLGVFRSLGALGRVMGPLIASLLYWHQGAAITYSMAIFGILLAIALLKKAPNKQI